MTNVQLRISILSVPPELSALKLRTWLLQQAGEIQQLSGENAFTQLKLHMTFRQRHSLPPKKLDKLLQGIVDKFPAIHNIELLVGEAPLSNDQMRVAAQKANVELNKMAECLDEYQSSLPGTTIH